MQSFLDRHKYTLPGAAAFLATRWLLRHSFFDAILLVVFLCWLTTRFFQLIPVVVLSLRFRRSDGLRNMLPDIVIVALVLAITVGRGHWLIKQADQRAAHLIADVNQFHAQHGYYPPSGFGLTVSDAGQDWTPHYRLVGGDPRVNLVGTGEYFLCRVYYFSEQRWEMCLD
jgi:hypothetical protein